MIHVKPTVVCGRCNVEAVVGRALQVPACGQPGLIMVMESGESYSQRGAKYCDDHVCLSVCSHNSKTTRPIFTKCSCVLPQGRN